MKKFECTKLALGSGDFIVHTDIEHLKLGELVRIIFEDEEYTAIINKFYFGGFTARDY